MPRVSDRASIHPYGDLQPALAEDVFVADGVRIIGDVSIAAGCSIWYNSVIRGDVHYVRIAEDSNIQDNCMLHVTHDTAPLIIGRGVTVGHQVSLHGCTIADYCLIGIGAIVLDHALVEEHSMVAAGAVITPGTVVPSGTLVAGVPARVIRELTTAEIEDFHAGALRYKAYAEKSWASLRAAARRD